MNDRYLESLKATHQKVALLLRAGNRLLVYGLALGSIFCLFSVYALQFIQQPEQALRLQAFMVNYSEFNRVEQPVVFVGSAMQSKKLKPQDPNWDGAVAGASLGLAVGRDVPMIGMVICPVVGAMVGYQLDSRI